MKSITKKLLIVGCLLWANASFSCSCGEEGSVEESFAGADIVIHGTAVQRSYTTIKETLNPNLGDSLEELVSIRDKDLLNSELATKIQVQVNKIYNGKVISDTVKVYTARQSSAFGYTQFKIGEEYIIYGDKESYFSSMMLYEKIADSEKNGTFWTNQCTRTTSYNELEANQLDGLAKN